MFGWLSVSLYLSHSFTLSLLVFAQWTCGWRATRQWLNGIRCVSQCVCSTMYVSLYLRYWQTIRKTTTTQKITTQRHAIFVCMASAEQSLQCSTLTSVGGTNEYLHEPPWPPPTNIQVCMSDDIYGPRQTMRWPVNIVLSLFSVRLICCCFFLFYFGIALSYAKPSNAHQGLQFSTKVSNNPHVRWLYSLVAMVDNWSPWWPCHAQYASSWLK